jgi:endonuclease/exonuclease/phosphatase family metal-dependent hydrolase
MSRPKTSRSNTLAGLALHLATRKAIQEKRASLGCGAILLGLLVLACVLACRCSAPSLRVATFNIENYPRDARQVEGAFATIEELGAPVVAVQEITDPRAFEVAARAHLGDTYRFVHDEGGQLQHVGVLYDASRFELAYARTHRETRLGPLGKPTLEVRLRRRGRGPALRVFVVHLKAGGDSSHIRREQLRQLTPLLRAAADSWDDVMLLGDFNATGPEDRETLRELALRTHLEWASEHLECTSYWNRSDGCRGAALDHVFRRERPRSVDARGPCESIGCSPGDRCPAFHREVSDHCPVTIDL